MNDRPRNGQSAGCFEQPGAPWARKKTGKRTGTLKLITSCAGLSRGTGYRNKQGLSPALFASPRARRFLSARGGIRIIRMVSVIIRSFHFVFDWWPCWLSHASPQLVAKRFQVCACCACACACVCARVFGSWVRTALTVINVTTMAKSKSQTHKQTHVDIKQSDATHPQKREAKSLGTKWRPRTARLV